MKVLGSGISGLLASPDEMRDFLRAIVARLGMRMLGEPVVHDVPIAIEKLGAEPFEDEGGVTGVAVLSTSHVAIHTWPVRHYFVLDVFSCRDFDTLLVVGQLSKSFGAFNMQVTDLSDALDYKSPGSYTNAISPP